VELYTPVKTLLRGVEPNSLLASGAPKLAAKRLKSIGVASTPPTVLSAWSRLSCSDASRS
jgi:hypothetical protein